ncbi:TetR/AcrR family transcriptional regulator [Diaphorobacter caeni]|uniref:TetR/AcrR family transcriptional regulator n=1 Tax=Diaphorobacter caeni TaxID=2784387 RepID=UPI00188F4567|nr:TetR/AcrR family transcriptional regulator [Diaphorobacter caeni]MBF5004958.1 TetR/AcrR family transcriptional regulator [Diaphorobacter caeni]
MKKTKSSEAVESVRPKTGGRGRKRSAAVEESVLDAAYELLSKEGFHATTVEAIAAKAQVSKATIYKWWPNRAAVIMSAFLREGAKSLPYPEEVTLQSVLARLMQMAYEFTGILGAMVKALIAESQSDPEIAQAFRDGYIAERRKQGVEIVIDAMKRGLINKADPNVVLDLLYAPLYYRLLVGHQPLTSEFVHEHVALAMKGLERVPNSIDLAIPPPTPSPAHSKKPTAKKSRTVAKVTR